MSDKNKKPVYHVYDIMQAQSINGKWDKKYSIKQRTVKLTEDQAATYNKNFNQSGRHYDMIEADVKVYAKTKSKA